MSKVDQTEAESWIESAITILEYVPHDDLQLRKVASAIELYGSGKYLAAIVAAREVVKPSRERRFPQYGVPRRKSLDELKNLFRVRIKRRWIGSSKS